MVLKRLEKLLHAERKRSPLSLDRLEIIVSTPLAIIAWISWHYVIWIQKFQYPEDIEVTSGDWYRIELNKLFGNYALLLGVVALISAISLVRAIRNDVRGVSRLGHLTLAWPLLFYESLPCFYFCFGVSGIVLAIVATLNSGRSEDNKWDATAALISFACCLLGFLFSWQWLNLVIP